MPLLQIQNLKTYFYQLGQTIRAVDGVSLDIEKGKITALVGESGSGKTVTALSITKLISPPGQIISGEVFFEGKDLLKLPEKELQKFRGAGISYIFQEPATSLNPVFTVGYQIAESIMLHKKLSKKESLRYAEELLSQVGIQKPKDRLSSYPHQLSGGMKQRAMIAMAICSQAKLLIADEPTTALDVTIQAQILNLIEELKDKLGLSVLLITHDLSIVEAVAGKVCIMRYGKIVEYGDTQQIFKNPSHPYTKELLDSIPRPSEFIRRQPDEEPLLEAKSIKKFFPIEKGPFRIKSGFIKAVDDVSFFIKRGEALGLVGESGSGKTTLGKILLALLKQDEGDFIYRGKKMQVIFQDPINSLDPKWKIKDAVAEPLIAKGEKSKKEIDQIVKGLLKEVGINPDFMRRRPHEFSGGEIQRISIARALAAEPDFIVCDEPVSSLDVSIQAQLLELLKNLQRKRDLAYLFISHDLRVISCISDRVMVMYKGKIVEEGETRQVYQNPKHPYTKQLLQSIT